MVLHFCYCATAEKEYNRYHGSTSKDDSPVKNGENNDDDATDAKTEPNKSDSIEADSSAAQNVQKLPDKNRGYDFGFDIRSDTYSISEYLVDFDKQIMTSWTVKLFKGKSDREVRYIDNKYHIVYNGGCLEL